MDNLDAYLVKKDRTIRETLGVIEKSEGKIAIVVDGQQILQGTVTDGDIRRGILNGHSVDDPVEKIMNTEPFTASEDEDRATIFSLMQARHIRNIPIVDKYKKVVDIINLYSYIIPENIDNWVVIMAGGFGKRLRPFTNTTPKPMLEIGGTPVLEILLNSFISQGFRRFYISVNYLADQIKDHFGDGSRYGIEIRYIEEEKPLDTAGSLSLLPHRPRHPFFVINADIITNIKFADMLEFHKSNGASATLGVREHKVQIPYGVVNLDDCKVQEFTEKPSESYFVNTGVYILNPEMLDLLPENEPFPMPELLEKAKGADKPVMAFPVTEYWLDIGRIEDFNRAEDVVKKIVS